MRFSFATVYTSVVITNLLILVVAFCMRRQHLQLKLGYRLLSILAVITTIRLVLPFEFPFTQTMHLPEFISRFLYAMQHTLYQLADYNVSIWTILCIIWLIGSITKLSCTVRDSRNLSYYIRMHSIDVTGQAPYNQILSRISAEHDGKMPFQVRLIDAKCTPMLHGLLHPSILIPKDITLSDLDLYFVMCHEAEHYYHRDMLLKYFLQVMSIMYWWNPAVHYLKADTSLLLEMHIDDKLTFKDTKTAEEYLCCLLNVAEKASERTSTFDTLTIGLCHTKDTHALKQRFEMVLHKPKKRNYLLHGALVLITVGLCALSYMYIFEVEYMFPEVEESYLLLTNNNSYVICNSDETYDVYLNGILIETVNSLDNYPEDIPIYQTKEDVLYENQ